MPTSAKSPAYALDNISSDRKPPVSESSAWSPNSVKPSSLLDAPPRLAPDMRSILPRPTDFSVPERLLNAREVAARPGVSERWVRDHTTRRSSRIRGVKLGTLMRYRCADVEEFMERLTTSRASMRPRFGG
jgi:predicted DNA-binding transcriptional regulator AlpA